MPHEQQADLLAYYRLLTARNEPLRFASIAPASLCDLHEFWMLTQGKRGRHGRQTVDEQRRTLRRALVKDGANPTAVSWWMKD